MNAVESLLMRLQLGEVIPAFKQNSIDKVVTLRSLTSDQLEVLIPNGEQRKRLVEALQRNSVDPPAPAGSVPQRVVAGQSSGLPPRYVEDDSGDHRVAASGNQGQRVCRFYRTPQGCKKGDKCNLLHSDVPGIPVGGTGVPRPAGRKPCREFFSSGCKYGDDCKFSHEQTDYRDGDAAPPVPMSKDTAETTVTIPSERVKLLLGHKAAKLNEINHKYGVTNSRITRPEEFRVQFSFTLHGSKDNVEKAKAEIEKLVGIKREHDIEARFLYNLNEYDRNVQAVQFLCAANVRNAGTKFELPESLLKRVVETFRFERKTDNVRQCWALSNHMDRDKCEIVQKFTKHMPGIQAIIFTTKERVEEMEKRKSTLTPYFPNVTPQFVHRDMKKEDRMVALDAFKAGEKASDGTVNRLLITTDDYAKYTRKVEIPHVNFIVHFTVPKTKELYLSRVMATGRSGNKGLSLMFVHHHDASTQKEWSEVLPLEEVKSNEPDSVIAERTVGLIFETATRVLTKPDCDPGDWRSVLEQPKAPRYTHKKQ